MSGRVPILRRQLCRDATVVCVSAGIVAACVALVLVLSGLRQGMSEQATLYLDRQPPIIVAQRDASHFLTQVSVLPESIERRLEAVAGVETATPIMQQFAMLDLHDKRVPSVLIGSDPGRAGGPWALDSGQRPRSAGEVTLDATFAQNHGVQVGEEVAFRGERLRVVGLTEDTTSFMLPLTFTTRLTAQKLSRRAGSAGFFLVEPQPGFGTQTVRASIDQAIPEVTALDRSALASSDRDLLIRAFSGPIAAMVGISMAIAMIVIAVTTHNLVSARTREFATLKAIGMPTRSLGRAVLGNGLIVAVLGLLLGLGIGFLAAAVVTEVTPQYRISIPPSSLVTVVIATPVVGALACLPPLRDIARIDPASAFRR